MTDTTLLIPAAHATRHGPLNMDTDVAPANDLGLKEEWEFKGLPLYIST